MVPQLPSVGESMKRVCKSSPRGPSTSVQINSVLSPLFFFSTQSDELRRHKCATFHAPTVSRTFTLEYPEDGPEDGQTPYIVALEVFSTMS